MFCVLEITYQTDCINVSGRINELFLLSVSDAIK